MSKTWIVFWWIVWFIPAYSQTSTTTRMNEDSIKVLWNAIKQEREEIQSLISQHKEILEKLKIQEEQNIKQISHYEKIKNDIKSLFGSKANLNQGNLFSPIFFLILLIPIMILLVLMLYLRFRYRRDLKQINDNLHGYLTESKNLITKLSDELEKTTEESIDKAKNRLRILELIMLEAGQKIKPITAGQVSIQESLQKLKSNLAPELEKSGSGARIYDRYKTSAAASTESAPAHTASGSEKKNDKATMVLLLNRRGFSVSEIASQLNMGQGEVELILSLRKHSQR